MKIFTELHMETVNIKCLRNTPEVGTLKSRFKETVKSTNNKRVIENY